VSRLRSDFFVSAQIRRAEIGGSPAMLRRRGGAESGAIIFIIDTLDGMGVVYGPAPQSSYESESLERAFTRLHREERIDRLAIEARIEKEIRFDPDAWVVEIEDRAGQHFLDHIV
jgi:hypothetical protein